MSEQAEHLIWRWHLIRDGYGFAARRRPSLGLDENDVAAGSYEAVQAAKRLLSGEAERCSLNGRK